MPRDIVKNEERNFRLISILIQISVRALVDRVNEDQTQATFRLQICSDMHIEFPKNEYPLVPSADALALIGDIGVICRKDYAPYIASCAKQFPTVYVILGNHEFYCSEYNEGLALAQAACDQAREGGSDVRLGHRMSTLLNGVRVLACTLWSRVLPQEKENVGMMLTDYRKITVIDKPGDQPRGITVDDTMSWFNEDVAWLRAEIAAARERGERVVVLTHHDPLLNIGGSNSEYMANPDACINSAFASDLLDLMQPPVAAWCFGHTHWFQDLTVNGVRVISNPKGYPHGEDIGLPFNPSFVVEL